MRNKSSTNFIPIAIRIQACDYYFLCEDFTQGTRFRATVRFHDQMASQFLVLGGHSNCLNEQCRTHYLYYLSQDGTEQFMLLSDDCLLLDWRHNCLLELAFHCYRRYSSFATGMKPDPV